MNCVQLTGWIQNELIKEEQFTEEELRKVLKLKLAVRKDWKTGNDESSVNYIWVKLFGSNAAYVRKYCQKGYLVSCTGC